MSKHVRILGIAGSLRRRSYNRAVLRAASELAPEVATIDTFELDGIPPFNEDDEQDPPEEVVEFKRCIREANAVLFVTPEYNYSIPGMLKNAIDWASRPYGDSAWSGKPAAVMGASLGALGTARAVPPAAGDGFPQHVPHQPARGDDRLGQRALRRRREPDRRGDEGVRRPVDSEPRGLDAPDRQQGVGCRRRAQRGAKITAR